MEQNNSNHRRFVTGYHKILGSLYIVGLIGSIVNLSKSISTDNIYSASLITLIFICLGLVGVFARSFALKAQDRAIRSEENFRHYILTGNPLPSALKMAQIVALRFSGDEEFPELALLAVKNNLSAKDIKSSIQLWKPDYNRV